MNSESFRISPRKRKLHDEASFDDASIFEGAQDLARDLESDDYHRGFSQRKTQTDRYDDLWSRQRKEISISLTRDFTYISWIPSFN